MYALELVSVTKRYGRTDVVNDLSLTVQPGRVTGFLGPNGAGKSTSMKILLDLISPDEGSATIGSGRYRDLPDPVHTVGAVLESNAFHPGRSGRNHLRILADASGVPHGRINELLEVVELVDAADHKVGGYSLGMRQRLGLAVALLGDPPVLVLDEPGNGLDPGGMRWLRDLLRSRAASGHTVFVSSHLLAEMEHLADDLIVIHKGRLVTTGTVSDLLAAATAVSVRTPSYEILRVLLEAAGGIVQEQEGGVLLVRGLPADEIGERAHYADIALHQLATQSGSLEELFLAWTGETSDPITASNLKEEVLI